MVLRWLAALSLALALSGCTGGSVPFSYEDENTFITVGVTWPFDGCASSDVAPDSMCMHPWFTVTNNADNPLFIAPDDVQLDIDGKNVEPSVVTVRDRDCWEAACATGPNEGIHVPPGATFEYVQKVWMEDVEPRNVQFTFTIEGYSLLEEGVTVFASDPLRIRDEMPCSNAWSASQCG